MTKDDALQLPAGPELDALVATHVFAQPWQVWMAMGPLSYSSEIEAAWQVVEKLRGQGLYLIINDTMSAYRARFWDVMWSIDEWVGAPDAAMTAWEKTAPLAICRAAIKTLWKD